MNTHLEPDILECEVKWALASITTKKASGGDGIPVELFQILKDELPKFVGAQYATEEQWRNNSRKNEDLHDPDNHDGVNTHLEPDILEYEVKWALESITTNKASGGDGIPVEPFQILKDDAVKVLHSRCQQTWKTQQWPQKWKRSVLISIPKAMSKNVQTTTQLHSSHTLVK